jgi:diguanylate cyclase (GGDEF)-like protein
MSEESSSRKPDITTLITRLMTFGLAVLVGAVLFTLVFLIDGKGLIDELEKKTFDMRVALQFGQEQTHRPSKDVIIVKFDDTTLINMEEEFGVWPWPRSVHADMIGFLNDVGARAIAYDIMFVAKKKGMEDSDKALVEAFRKYKNVYLSMNFDNSRFLSDSKLHKGITLKDIHKIEPLSLPLTNQLKPNNADGIVVQDGFFANDAMTFNSFRRIMPEFLEEKNRVAFINHGRDKDGVSRSNPLFFRFLYTEPKISADKPYQQKTDESGKSTYWVDAKGARVDEEGVYLDEHGRAKGTMQVRYFPYLGMKLAMDLARQKSENKSLAEISDDPPMTLTENGRLQFGNFDIPLLKKGPTAGSMLVNWYNVDIDREETQEVLAHLEQRYQELQDKLKAATPVKIPELRKEADLYQEYIQRLRQSLEREFEPNPYKQIPAWEILGLMKSKQEGTLTAEDKQKIAFLKDKIIFIGTTAVSTYDIKTTPIHKLLPGVILQATIFDNLYQNRDYMRRADESLNLGLTVLLCILASWVIYRMRSAISGLVTTLTLVSLYVMGAFVVLKTSYLWLNIAMPMISVAIVTIVTFMVKYMNRDLDYKKTYQLATTDGLTGLHNHRYFQEQLATLLENAGKANGNFSVILVDIDFFKKFNDTYGHQAGDEVLRCVAQKLKNSVRSNDLVARYGGEEMAVLLDKASQKESLEVAKKLCRMVGEEAYPIAEGVTKHVTVSIGVATYPFHGKTGADLIEFADKGLYRAKESGRNRVGAQFDDEGESEGEDADKPVSPTPVH